MCVCFYGVSMLIPKVLMGVERVGGRKGCSVGSVEGRLLVRFEFGTD